MKKLWLLLALLVASAGTVHAGILGDDNVHLRYRVSVAAGVSTSTIVIDLSNDTTWPHDGTRELNIAALQVSVDKVAASSPTVKLGVVTFVNASTGSVTWFYSKENAKNVSNTDVRDAYSYGIIDNIRLRVNPVAATVGPNLEGLTPYVFSNDTTLGSTTYQTDVILPSASGSHIAPGVGDLILSVVNPDATNAVVVNVELQYHAEAK